MIQLQYKERMCWIVILLSSSFITFLQAETVYFLVGEIDEYKFNDSYVLPLDKPEDIAYARRIIEEPFSENNDLYYIIVAKIDRWDPNDGVNPNRNHLQAGKPAWSWYVTEFVNFTGHTVEVLDGWPDWVERDGEWWIGNTTLGTPNGHIGFWGYSIIAELGHDLEPWNCDLTADEIVNLDDFAWFASQWLNADCGHRSYCDGTDINGSGLVDLTDFCILARHWLF